MKVCPSGLSMDDQRSGDCKIGIAISRPDDCESNSIGKPSVFIRLNKVPALRLVVGKFLRKAWKLGKDDPRRVIHSIKVGIALTVVSLFYFLKPSFEGVGDNAIWAIMTVVVVFEFTAGATLSKGLNRGIGTVLAGSLGLSVGYIANAVGGIGEPIIICFSCFILGASATYFRFFPKIKSKYDYGVVIFILTFNMIAISGYRPVGNILTIAYQRFCTIAIGCAICLVISLLVCPIWAGEDLHKSIITKIQGLGDSIEVCVQEYFKDLNGLDDGSTGESIENKICQGYRDVLDSKASEDSLATFASWEPRHGKFRFNHPWKQYVKLGSMIRQLAYCVVALHGCLRSEIQVPHLNKAAFEKPCTTAGTEVARVLRELAESISCMKQCPPSESLMESVRDAIEELSTAFSLQPKLFHVIQPFYSPDQNHSTAETNDINPNTSQTEASPDHQILQIFKDSEHPYCIPDLYKHKSCPELFSPTVKDHLDSPTRVLDIASQRNYILSTSGCLRRSKGPSVVEYTETFPLAAFASLLIEIVARLEHVIDAVQELGKLAAFQA